MAFSERFSLPRERLSALLSLLRAEGFALVGPRLRAGAIVYDTLQPDEELPSGFGESQAPGSYRLTRRTDAMVFGTQVPQHSWKQFLFEPRLRLWSARREGPGFSVQSEEPERPRFAFIGARPCDLQAIAVQDRTFLGEPFVERHYQARREGLFVVAVHCREPGGTCFCASMGTGPRATRGFDLALTELIDAEGHRFVMEIGSQEGGRLLERLGVSPASPEDCRRAEALLEAAKGRMGRSLDTADLPKLLARNLQHPRWDEVAERCLACTNCTLVCPTCFCSTVEDRSSVRGDGAERLRRWDSCFTLDHSRLHGGPVRASHRARYRQWLTHKVGTWHAQFGVSGCVGCGRCITWCPVGIDLTEELGAIRARDGAVA